MNCREAQHHLFAERESALENSQRAALDSHVAHCADCRRIRDELASALTMWRTKAQNVSVPDATSEWHAIRRKIRGGIETGEVRLTPRRSPWLAWIAAPVAAAAALTVALTLAPGTRSDGTGNEIARAEFVDASDSKSSTMVVVDQKSGWLFVMASDASPHQGD